MCFIKLMTKYIVESISEPVCLCIDGQLHLTPLDAEFHVQEFNSMTEAAIAIIELGSLQFSFNLIITPKEASPKQLSLL